MAKTTTLPVTQNIQMSFATLVTGSGIISGESGTSVSGLVSVYTAPADDAIVKSIMIASSDTSARVVGLYVRSGSADYVIGHVNVPIGAGITSGTTANIDYLTSPYVTGFPLDSSGKPVLPLQSGSILKAGAVTAVTNGKTITITAIAESYT